MTLSPIAAMWRFARRVLGPALLLVAIPLSFGGVSGGQQAVAQARLTHAPTGTVTLAWTKDNGGTMTVAIAMSGLAPGSTHPAHIHTGTCDTANAMTGSVEYPLNNVVANTRGQGTSQTTVTGLNAGSRAGALIIHNGPALTTSNLPWRDQSLPIACANVAALATSPEQPTKVSATIGMTPAVDQQVAGTTDLRIDRGKLVVTLSATHLQPHSEHVAHIHSGSCSNQGPIVYTLNTLAANRDGDAVSKTVIDGVNSIPANGWYVNVHLAPTMTDLVTQTGFTPIACGNVQAGG